MNPKNTPIFLGVAVMIVLALTIIDTGPAEPPQAAIISADHPTIASGGDHVGLNITTTLKNVGGTRGVFGVIAQPDYARTEGVWIEPSGECVFTHIAGVYMPNHDYDVQLQAYCFINGSYRIDDTKNITILADELTVFRERCISNGVVVCEWGVLKEYLENHTVSRVWWNLTEVERRSIAEKAVTNTINNVIWYYRHGESGDWKKLTAPCTYNAIIRFQKFGTPIGWDDCYWKYNSYSTEVYEYAPEHYYGLPVVHVNTVTHAMCGIQVVCGINSLNNWVVFQYTDFDIKPGDRQMPHGKRIIIQDPFPYTGTLYNCVGFDSNIITEFQI